MSGAQYFNDGFAINSHMHGENNVNLALAQSEHNQIKESLITADVEVVQVPPPPNCQDGVYTANWALTRGNKAVLSNLPNKRVEEMPYAEKTLESLGYEIIKLPEGIRFSGQGDALPCGDLLFTGQTYRTDIEAHQLLAEHLGFKVISLKTIPDIDPTGKPIINKITGWPDSYFYDIDLALAIISPELIAWCPDAFMSESRQLIRSLDIEKIGVSMDEAMTGFACNLVSTGQTVIMSANAPGLKAELEARGLTTITPKISELGKGGGYIRCTTLTLSQ